MDMEHGHGTQHMDTDMDTVTDMDTDTDMASALEIIKKWLCMVFMQFWIIFWYIKLKLDLKYTRQRHPDTDMASALASASKMSKKIIN